MMINKPYFSFKNNTKKWDPVSLGDVLKINSGKDYKHLNVGEIPVYGTGGYMLSVDQSLSKENAIGIGRKGTIDKPQLLYAPFWTVDTLFFMTPQKNNDLYFLYTYMQKINWKSYDESSGVPSLSKLNIEKINMFVPDGKEQVQIGSFFKYLDETIALHHQELDALKQTKQGFLQKMFPKNEATIPEIRFPEFRGDWRLTTLGEIAEIVRGASPRPIQNPKWFDDTSEVGWLRISDVTEQNGRIHRLEQRLSVDGQSKTRVLTKPHLMLSIAATVGKPVINYVSTGVHDGFLIFKNPQFDIEFMFQWLEMFRLKWSKYGQPGSQVNLNSELVRNQILYLPDIKEQIKIGIFFRQIDEVIELKEQELEALKQTKKGFLQKMFV